MNITISKAYKIAEKDFIEIIAKSTSCADAMRLMGFGCTTGNANKKVKQRIKELNIDTSHGGKNTRNAHAANKYPDDVYFRAGCARSGPTTRNRIIKDHLMPYECAICGNKGVGQNKPLILQVDHINGDHNDNRLENLRLLCPNCHTQTSSYAGKNVSTKK